VVDVTAKNQMPGTCFLAFIDAFLAFKKCEEGAFCLYACMGPESHNVYSSVPLKLAKYIRHPNILINTYNYPNIYS
jgi:hypothetical protein